MTRVLVYLVSILTFSLSVSAEEGMQEKTYFYYNDRLTSILSCFSNESSYSSGKPKVTIYQDNYDLFAWVSTVYSIPTKNDVVRVRYNNKTDSFEQIENQYPRFQHSINGPVVKSTHLTTGLKVKLSRTQMVQTFWGPGFKGVVVATTGPEGNRLLEQNGVMACCDSRDNMRCTDE